HRDGVADAVDGQEEEGEQDLLPKFRDDEDGFQLAHWSAPWHATEGSRHTPCAVQLRHTECAYYDAYERTAWPVLLARTCDQLSFLLSRAFILFLLGFFGGRTRSVVPPAAVIFSRADFEKWCAFTVSFFFSSPVPRI